MRLKQPVPTQVEVMCRLVSGSYVVTVPKAIQRRLRWKNKDMLVVHVFADGTLSYKRKPPTRKRRAQRDPLALDTPVEAPTAPQEGRSDTL